MKYRVKEKGHWFTPQYKYNWWPVWFDYKKRLKVSGRWEMLDADFLSREEAVNHINSTIKSVKETALKKKADKVRDVPKYHTVDVMEQ